MQGFFFIEDTPENKESVVQSDQQKAQKISTDVFPVVNGVRTKESQALLTKFKHKVK